MAIHLNIFVAAPLLDHTDQWQVALREAGYAATWHAFTSLSELHRTLQTSPAPHLIVCPDDTSSVGASAILDALKETPNAPSVCVMSTTPSVERAVALLRAGAAHYQACDDMLTLMSTIPYLMATDHYSAMAPPHATTIEHLSSQGAFWLTSEGRLLNTPFDLAFLLNSTVADLRDKAFRTLLTPSQQALLDHLLQQAYTTQTPIFAHLCMQTAEGYPRWIECLWEHREHPAYGSALYVRYRDITAAVESPPETSTSLHGVSETFETFLQQLIHLLRITTMTSDTTAYFRALVNFVQQFTPFQTLRVWQYTPDGNHRQRRYHIGNGEHTTSAFAPIDGSLPDQAFTLQHPVSHAFDTNKDLPASIAVPFTCGGTLGVLELVGTSTTLYRREHVLALTIAANAIGIMLENHRLLAKSEESRRRYRFVATMTADYACAYQRQEDGTTQLVWETPGRETILGTASSTPLDIHEWEARAHPHDRLRLRAFHLSMWHTPNASIEYRLQDAHGAWRWITLTSRLEDNRTCYLAMHDNTPRRRHEHERQALLTLAQGLRNADTFDAAIEALLDSITHLYEADGVAFIPLHTTLPSRALGLLNNGAAIRRWLQSVHTRQMDTLPLLEYQHTHYHATSVTLTSHDNQLGTLILVRDVPLDHHETALLQSLCDFAANALHRLKLHAETRHQLHLLQSLRRIDMSIVGSMDTLLPLSVFAQEALHHLPIMGVAVYTFDQVEHTFERLLWDGKAMPATPPAYIPATQAPWQTLIRTQHALHLSPEQAEWAQTFLAMLDIPFCDAMPLIAKGELQGMVLFFAHAAWPDDEHLHQTRDLLVGQAAIALDNGRMLVSIQRLNFDLQLAYEETIEGWARLLDLRDEETEGHSRRVADLTVQMCHALGIPDERLRFIRYGALLHDIGKMVIPDTILRKPGPLSNEERTLMRKHPEMAQRILSRIHFLEPALAIPLCHHEKWDGTGYPRGLKGEEIPIEARIFAIADVYDALTHNRPYRKARSHEEALAYIRSQRGLHFEPRLVDLFERMFASA